jgi:hypothetical protein
MGKDLRRCLEVIHDDIVIIWNFPSLDMVRFNEPSPICLRPIRFSYLMMISEEEYPSWWQASPNRKDLRRTTVCKCLWASSVFILLLLTLVLTQSSKRSEYRRGS